MTGSRAAASIRSRSYTVVLEACWSAHLAPLVETGARYRQVGSYLAAGRFVRLRPDRSDGAQIRHLSLEDAVDLFGKVRLARRR